MLLAGDQEPEPIGVILHLEVRLQELRGPLQQVPVLVRHALELLEAYKR